MGWSAIRKHATSIIKPFSTFVHAATQLWIHQTNNDYLLPLDKGKIEDFFKDNSFLIA